MVGLRARYHDQMVERIGKSRGNEICFLPTGLGVSSVVDRLIQQSLEKVPKKHVIVCVLRPAQALSHAARIRRALGTVSVGAYVHIVICVLF